MSEVAEQEGGVDERRCLREGRHVSRRYDGKVHGSPLSHVLEVLLFEAEFAVLVQNDIQGLAIASFGHLAELRQRLRKCMIVVELRSAVEFDRGLGTDGRCTASQPNSEQTRCK